jgi:Fe-S cluster assembly protein SufD
MELQIITNPEGQVRIALEANASAEYLVLQDGTGASARSCDTEYDISLAEGASLKMVFLSLDGPLLRNKLRVSLQGHDAVCDLAGLCLADGSQQMAYDVLMTHQVSQCRSTQLFKNIVGGSAVTHFDGLIHVVPDAQKTEAYQANHNLLASDTARAYTRPQLEIYADDVKCSHGATIGRLNPDELFYLRSRGIPQAEARLLQQLAFCHEVLEKISSAEWSEKMQALVEEKLRKLSVSC